MKKQRDAVGSTTKKQRQITAFFLLSLHEVFHAQPATLIEGVELMHMSGGMECSAKEAHDAVVAVIYELMPGLNEDMGDLDEV
jgi:hypothetical protein